MKLVVIFATILFIQITAQAGDVYYEVLRWDQFQQKLLDVIGGPKEEIFEGQTANGEKCHVEFTVKDPKFLSIDVRTDAVQPGKKLPHSFSVTPHDYFYARDYSRYIFVNFGEMDQAWKKLELVKHRGLFGNSLEVKIYFSFNNSEEEPATYEYESGVCEVKI